MEIKEENIIWGDKKVVVMFEIPTPPTPVDMKVNEAELLNEIETLYRPLVKLTTAFLTASMLSGEDAIPNIKTLYSAIKLASEESLAALQRRQELNKMKGI